MAEITQRLSSLSTTFTGGSQLGIYREILKRALANFGHPGVTAERVDVRLDGRELIIAGVRPLPNCCATGN